MKKTKDLGWHRHTKYRNAAIIKPRKTKNYSNIYMHTIKFFFGKSLEAIGKVFYSFFTLLFELYGWQGFLFRAVSVVVFLKLSTLGSPEYNIGTSGGKLAIAAWGLLAYAICKLIYDYTKSGKETQEKKRNN